MSKQLPRITYSNVNADLSDFHDYLDQAIPEFERAVLSKTWSTPFATGAAVGMASPIDPSLTLGNFPTSSPADIQTAVAHAREGAKIWNHATVAERLGFAERWKAQITEAKYSLGLAALYEVGKSRIEAMGEAEEAQDMLDYYPAELKAHDGFRRPMNQLVAHETALSVLKPYGVFAVISPFNFPVALSIGPIVCALLAGNAVVFKPSPECALTALMIAQTIKDAGLPDGVFNIVLGGAEVGRLLTTDEGIDGVAFTGSHNTGMEIFRHMATGRWMKPVLAEMGGKNPAYVTKNADLDRASQGVVRSAFGLQGQKCSACSVVYVDNQIKDAFIERCKSFAAKLIVGDPRKAGTFMGPLYNSATADRFAKAVAQVRANGVLHFGGEHLDGKPMNYVVPAIAEMPGPGDLTRQELFMPFLVVRGVDNLEEGLREGNSTSYGLSAGVYTENQSELELFLGRAEAGVLYANRASGATTGAWPGAQPFCGWKGSGVSGKGGLGPYYLPQFMREQSQTIMTK